MTKDELDKFIDKCQTKLKTVDDHIADIEREIDELKRAKQDTKVKERRIQARLPGTEDKEFMTARLIKARQDENALDEEIYHKRNQELADFRAQHQKLRNGVDKLGQLDAEITKMLDRADAWHKDLQSLL